MEDTMIGVDLAKAVFEVHGASMAGQVKFRKKLSRQQFRIFLAGHSPAVVVMEACASAHYWSRELIKLGHEVKLIARNMCGLSSSARKTMRQIPRQL